MTMRLANQMALVTGGSRGIGRAICQALDAEGARIIIHYHRNRRAAEEPSASLHEEPMLVQADLSSVASIEAAFMTGQSLNVSGGFLV
jgi:3-oxoacyl-[acyl-carrier protein] reductase